MNENPLKNFKLKNFYSFMMMLMVCLMTNVAFAQSSVKVSGKVLDSSKNPIIGATVIIDGTTKGIITDQNGAFMLDVPSKESVLVIEFMGYEAQKVTVGSKTNIIVELKEESLEVEEVVVVGYGTQKRESLVGAVSDVSGKEILQAGISNLSSAIQDALPGVVATISSGTPGSDDATLTVRGNSDPLILVDGVEAVGGFSQIDPGEVASISLLKDAASTAVYGVKGANGVLLITTRRGRKGAPQFSLSASQTIKVTDDSYLPKASSYDLLEMRNTAAKNYNNFDILYAQSYMDNWLDPDRDQVLYADTDWYDLMMKDFSTESTARVNVSGGTDRVNYFTSLSFNNQGDVYNTEKNGFYDPSFDYTKINFRTNLDFQITKTTKLTTDISGRRETTNEPNIDLDVSDWSSLYKLLAQQNPLLPVYYTEEFIETYPDDLNPWDGDVRYSQTDSYQYNVWQWLNYSGFKTTRDDVLDFSISLNQDLNFITEGLSASARYNRSTTSTYYKTNSYDIDTYYFNPETLTWSKYDNNPNSTTLGFHPSGGESFSSYSDYIYYEGKLNYNRTFNDAHNVNIVGVFNRSIQKTGLTSFPYYREDWVGRVQYDYKSKYIVEFNASYNGSERYAPGNRFGFFPSGAIGWNIANEQFVKDNAKWLNTLKLRYSLGKTGQDTGDRFMYEGGWGYISSIYTPSGAGVGDPFVSAGSRLGELQLANPDATWETAVTQNIGLDGELFDRKLTFSLDLYDEQRSGILMTPVMVKYFNAGAGNKYSVSVPSINAGKTKKHGYEFEVNYRDNTSGGFYYNIGGFASFNENRVVYTNDAEYTPDYLKNAGKSSSKYQLYETTGYINTFEELVNSVAISGTSANVTTGSYNFVDYNGDGSIDSYDRIYYPTSTPDLTYGFNLGARYKGWELQLRFYGKHGVYYVGSYEYMMPQFDGNLMYASTEHLDTWSPSNQDAAYPSFLYGSLYSYSMATESTSYTNCSYLRLQNANLSYRFDASWLKKNLSISALTLRLTAQNLFTISGLEYGDPEGGNGLTFNYPLSRRYVFSLDVNF